MTEFSFLDKNENLFNVLDHIKFSLPMFLTFAFYNYECRFIFSSHNTLNSIENLKIKNLLIRHYVKLSEIPVLVSH